MNIATSTPIKPASYNARPQVESTNTNEKDMIDRIVDRTYLGANYAGSVAGGGLAGGAAWVVQGPKETVKNAGSMMAGIWKTEKLGPTLKTLGIAASIPVTLAGGLIAAPVSLIGGMFRGGGQVDHSQPRQFTIDVATTHSYNKTSDSLKNISKDFRAEMKELGEYKLAEGEKPIDIPLFKTAKTLAVGAVAGVIGGAAGLVSAVGAFATEAGKGVANAFTDKDLHVGKKLFAATTSVAGAAVHGTSYGVRTGLATFGNAISTTWDKDSLFQGLGSIGSDVKNGVAASVAPRSVLLEEKPANA